MGALKSGTSTINHMLNSHGNDEKNKMLPHFVTRRRQLILSHITYSHCYKCVLCCMRLYVQSNYVNGCGLGNSMELEFFILFFVFR